MAKTIKFNIRLNVDGKEQIAVATASTKELAKAMDKGGKSTASFKNQITALGQTVTTIKGLSDSMGKLLGVMQGLTEAYNTSQQVNTQLTTVMRERMDATDSDIAKVKEVISAQKQLGVVSGAVQMRGAQQIATFLSEKATLQTLIPAMNNLIAQQKGLNATQEDAYSVANLMGKAMQGQTTALKRVGITFDDYQKKVMETGTESQRAAMLAEIITANVGNMNEELGKTDAGKLKIASNELAAMKVRIGAVVAQWLPMVSMAAQSMMIATSVITLGTSFRGLVLTITKAVAATKILNAASTALRASKIGLSAVVTALSAKLNGETVAATTAAVATRTLGMAVKGLMIASGVGIAIAVLSTAFEALASSSSSAEDAQAKLEAEQEASREAAKQEAKEIASVTGEVENNIAALKNFHGSKADEKKLVDEMNAKYGEAMGYYSTVSQWYTALTANSKTYCAQMVNEIRMRNLANQAAEAEADAHNIAYDETGKRRVYSGKNRTRRVWKSANGAGNYQVDEEIAGSSDKAKAQTAYNRAIAKRNSAKRQMEALMGNTYTYKHTQGYSPTMPTAGGGKSGGKSGGGGKKTVKPGTVDWYENAIKGQESIINSSATTATQVDAARTKIAQLKHDLQELKIKLGIEDVPTIEVEKKAENICDTIKEKMDEFNKNFTPLSTDSSNDKLASYQGASSEIGNIQEKYEIGIIGADEAQRQIDLINDELEQMGMKPIKIDIDTGQALEALDSLGSVNISSMDSITDNLNSLKQLSNMTGGGMAVAGESAIMLGQALQQLGSDSAEAKAGMILAAVGNIALSFAKAMNSASSNWVTWLAFAISGTATMASTIAQINRYATGGIIGGNSVSGDKMLARVNSGEMILNRNQQSNLFKLLNHQTQVPQGYQMPRLDGAALSAIQPQPVSVQIHSKIRGGDIIQSVANTSRTMARSGRRSNITV